MTRALITGASGFVGSHLVPYLHQKGFEIWASYHHRLRKFPFHVRWVQVDLTHFDKTLNLVRQSRPDFIFHMAGQAVPSNSWRNPGATIRLNVEASIFLLEAVSRFAPKARVLLASSSHVYGRAFFKKKRVREKDLAIPVNPYGASKLLMELVGLNFVKSHNLDIVISRTFNQIGTGQNPRLAFADFCRQIARMEEDKQNAVLKVGDINVTRDFIHVRDAARAYLLLLKKGKKGEIYNVGSGRAITLKRVVNFLRKKSGLPFKVASESDRIRKSDLPWVVSDPSRLKALGWRPRESVWKGLTEILDEQRKKPRLRCL